MGNIDESGIDALPQLDDLGTHLVAQLGIQVGKRLIHQEYLGAAHNGTADGYALTLAAGKRLGLAVQVLGDIQDLGGFLYLAVDLLRVYMAQLQAEGHVLVNSHMGVQGVVLENHRDIPVLGRNVVHQLAVNIQLAAGDLLQPGDHAQGGGFTAAGRADQHNELIVLDLQVEVMHRQYALFGHQQVVLLFLFGLAFFLLFGFDVGVHLFNVFQYDISHYYRSERSAFARPFSQQRKRDSLCFTAGLHTAAPGAPGGGFLLCFVRGGQCVEWPAGSEYWFCCRKRFQQLSLL